MSRALVTDLYELNMAVSYLRRGMVGPATFSLFVRSLPPRRGFLVAAGLEDCLAFLERFALTGEDPDWLRVAPGARADGPPTPTWSPFLPPPRCARRWIGPSTRV